MAKTTLCHPVALPAIRGLLIHAGIVASRITQVRYDPSNLRAEYDVVIVSMQSCPYRVDQWTPQDVRFGMDVALTGNMECEYVVWRRDHWSAHIATWFTPEVPPVSDRPIRPEIGSDEWIAQQEGIDMCGKEGADERADGKNYCSTCWTIWDS